MLPLHNNIVQLFLIEINLKFRAERGREIRVIEGFGGVCWLLTFQVWHSMHKEWPAPTSRACAEREVERAWVSRERVNEREREREGEGEGERETAWREKRDRERR